MKYKVGDKVRVRKDLKGTSAVDSMFKYGGKKATIIKIDCDGAYRLSISPYFYWFNDEMLDPVEDIIEYKGKKYDVVDEFNRHIVDIDLDIGKSTREEHDELILTLKEHKEEILDEEEKKYLSAVIKPFRDEVEYICRNARYNGTLKKGGYSYISIKCKNDEDFCYRSGLPIFETDTMYKGMELDKEYTLDQLGL